jgi:hypothetical protein
LAEVEAQQVVVLLRDRSGAIEDTAREAAATTRDDAVSLAQQLPPATHIFGRYIASESYRGAEAFLADALPAAPPPFDCVVTNPFDPRQRRHCQQQKRLYEAQRTCLELARKRIATALQRPAPPRGTRTDVWGALAVAAEIFAAYPPTGRWLIVYSALDDTVTRLVPAQVPQFQGAKVLVRVPRTALGTQGKQRLVAFKQCLEGWGAQVAAPPFEMPWPAVFRDVNRLFAEGLPPVDPHATALAAFMATLERGPYGVIVASHATETEARTEVHRIRATYPELRPSHGPALDGKWWAVGIGDFYTRESAEALKAKAIALGLRHDTFVWDTRRY